MIQKQNYNIGSYTYRATVSIPLKMHNALKQLAIMENTSIPRIIVKLLEAALTELKEKGIIE